MMASSSARETSGGAKGIQTRICVDMPLKPGKPHGYKTDQLTVSQCQSAVPAYVPAPPPNTHCKRTQSAGHFTNRFTTLPPLRGWLPLQPIHGCTCRCRPWPQLAHSASRLEYRRLTQVQWSSSQQQQYKEEKACVPWVSHCDLRDDEQPSHPPQTPPPRRPTVMSHARQAAR